MTYRQTWAARIQLEAACHASSTFFTLTYSPDALPDPPQLQPDDLQKFLKRLRRKLEPTKIRFFACGEYGAKSLRPHYHGVLFGCEATPSLEGVVAASWTSGFIQLAPLTPARAAYVAKYVCKDVSGDDQILEGWQREFARMSNKPGIGAKYVERMSAAVNHTNDRQADRGFPPVTQLLKGSMRIGPVFYPVGRYLRDKMKEQVRLGNATDTSVALSADIKFKQAARAAKGGDVSAREAEQKQRHLNARKRLRKNPGVL